MRKILIVYFLVLAHCHLWAQNRTLDYYIGQALKNSPLLKDYELQIASNGVDSLRVKATFKPQVGLNGQVYYTPSYNGYGYDGAVTNGGNYQLQVNASQQLIMRRPKHAQLQSLDIQNQSLSNTSKISELDLKRSVTELYIIAYRDFSMIRSVNEILSLLNDEEELLKPLIQRGIYAQTDFLNLQLAKEGQRLTLRQDEILYKNDLFALNILCGLEDTVFPELAKPVISVDEQINLANSILLRQYHIDS